MNTKKDFDYELIDCGDARRIERFAGVTVDRSCPQAFWRKKLKTDVSDVFFVRGSKSTEWIGAENVKESWPIRIGKVTAELKFSNNGQVGIFPEQLDNWKWIEEKVAQNKDRSLKILNLFAYTGIATLFASEEHTEVCHVDGAKSAINWAKKNAELSGKSENHIRWICDDVRTFLAREIKRGNKYDGVILDPPAFGRGAKKDWKIERDLSDLMRMVGSVLSDDPLFVILTCHAPDHFSPSGIVNIVESIPQFEGKKAEKLLLNIPSKKGNELLSSFGARICN